MTDTIIDVAGIAKQFGRTRAVADVSFAVRRGEIFGILGPNGAGKTTTVEIVAGLRAADAGAVRVLGVDPRRDRAVVRRHVGMQLQHSELPERMTVEEALRLYASCYDHTADIDELVDVLGLGDCLARRYARLSGGQQQRLSIALALVGDPTVAILDELTTGLDPAARRDTWQFVERVRDRGVTVLLVTHFMPEAEYLCDRLAVIDAGRVTALDTPARIVADHVPAYQRIRFQPSAPVADAVLADLPGVRSVTRHGDQIVIDGDDAALTSVTTALARAGIVARGLRVDQQSLDDAFLALTRPTKDHLT